MVRTLTPNRNRAWAPMEDWYREMDQLVNQFLAGGNGNRETKAPYPAPADVLETSEQFEVTLDLPGVKPEEVEVELRDGHLVISGERKAQQSAEGKAVHRIERRYGAFRRVLAIPEQVDQARIAAEYRHGVLTVILPKSERVKPTRIQVKTECSE